MAEQKIELRKTRDFSDNLNDTILFIRRNLKPLLISFLGIAGVFMLASAITSGIYQSQFGSVFQDILNRKKVQQQSPFDVISLNYFLVVFFSWLNFISMQTAIISYMKVYENKDGDTPQVNEVWTVFRQYFFKVFFYTIPVFVLTLIGIMLCILPGVYLGVVFVPFATILIMEDAGFSEAYNRCFRLIKDNFWVSFLIYFLTYLIAAFSGGIISIVIGTISGLISYFTTKDLTITVGIITSILDFFSLIFYMVFFVAVCLHYYNLTEKYDGTGMMKKLNTLGSNDAHFDNTQEQY